MRALLLCSSVGSDWDVLDYLGHTERILELARTRFWWKEDSSRTLRLPANEQPCGHLSSHLLL